MKYVENLDAIMQKFDIYYGTYFYFPLFILGIVIIFSITKKNNYTAKTICFCLPIVSMLVVFNPLIHKVFSPFVEQGDDYWRFFWIIPIGTVLGYCFSSLALRKNKFIEKLVVTILLITVLCLSGKLVYSEDNFQKVNNLYKMPDDILKTINIIQQIGVEEKKVMMPISLVPWIRQFDGTIKMQYNRVPSGRYDKYIFDFDNGSIKKYMKKYIEEQCNIIIINQAIDYDCDLEQYGYNFYEETEKYKIYFNNEL